MTIHLTGLLEQFKEKRYPTSPLNKKKKPTAAHHSPATDFSRDYDEQA
jgi:hypothetical protein